MNHDFEQFYASQDQVWSGNPNENLVNALGDVPPGTALDIGCGEGADVKWLHDQGWVVTGIDPSATAIERTRAKCPEATLHVGTFEELELGTYDLIVASYVPLAKDAGKKLKACLNDGGKLVLLHHEFPLHQAPEDYLMPHNAHELLGGEWDIKVTKKQRSVQHGKGKHHKDDLLLTATVREHAK
ncbi:class I SAM-dependent methyltransferase [Corynebacterium epidermidicanis]|uniref:Methyltransferase domain n=1 Tax=Corynebacterium epidermidicanis TaxID=1050174 RepID=A0A0G3GTT1_9CORY|nr:class I SAM-dependent methyltransferase [Corynebacterium epidermidicanis]AKK02963.1 Methyltransferase domain [Corynebacterium epidermidicanis]